MRMFVIDTETAPDVQAAAITAANALLKAMLTRALG